MVQSAPKASPAKRLRALIEEMLQKIRAAAEARVDPVSGVSSNCAPSPGYGAA